MRILKTSVLIVVAIVIANSGSVFADITPSEIVAKFNGLQDGNGWSFSTTIHGELGDTEWLFSTNGDLVDETTTPDLSVYTGATSTTDGTFYTFCANNVVTIPNGDISGYALLNYDPTTGETKNISGVALTVGAAWLYSQYAQGALDGFRYDPDVNTAGSERYEDALLLRETLLLVTTVTAEEIGNAASTNKFVRALLNANPSTDYWVETYDVNKFYSEIGNIAVFVMNLTSGTGGTGEEYQDMYYATVVDYGGEAPEPTTLLLWVLGSIGTLGVGYCRKRSNRS